MNFGMSRTGLDSNVQITHTIRDARNLQEFDSTSACNDAMLPARSDTVKPRDPSIDPQQSAPSVQGDSIWNTAELKWNPDSDIGTAFDVTTPLQPFQRPSGYQAPLPPIPMGTVLKGSRNSYLIRRALGAGGMGAVYLAEKQDPTEQDNLLPIPDEVAVKLFKTDVGNDAGDLLKRELSAMRALQHSRVPQVFDWCLKPPVTFAVFPYYSNGSLADQIAMKGQLPIAQVWRLFEDLLSALSAAHRAALLHLDVKPGNVLCASDDSFLLSDFGISQGFLVSRSVLAAGLGAPVFQSPEQKRGDSDAFDERTDLWGAGITIWTALTGAMPLDLRNLVLACTKGLHGLPPPTALRPDCPPALEELLMPLVSNDPDKRPGSAAETLARLQSVRPNAEQGPQQLQAPALSPAGSAVRRALFENLMDPLWRSICKTGELNDRIVHFRQDEMLCGAGANSYRTFVLLRGAVRIERDGEVLGVEEREGSFIGEVTSLIGAPRTASMTAVGDVWVLVFNPAQLERFVTRNPAVAIRLMKVLAERLHRESERNRTAVKQEPDSGVSRSDT